MVGIIPYPTMKMPVRNSSHSPDPSVNPRAGGRQIRRSANEGRSRLTEWDNFLSEAPSAEEEGGKGGSLFPGISL